MLVAGTEPPDVVELWEWTLGPADRHVSEAHAAGTRELVQVQQGTITIDIADEQVTLGVGDAVAFPGDVAHSYANPHDGPPGSRWPCSSRVWDRAPGRRSRHG